MTRREVEKLVRDEARRRGVSVARLREVARERLAAVANDFTRNEVP